MQKHEKIKLKNGPEIHFLFDKLFTTSSIQMCFKVGWRYDSDEHLGLAHLFEHLVGKRTSRYREKSEFSKKLDELGILTNASTGPDTTVYFQNQINENILVSLEMLIEAIYNSEFEEEDLEKEKHVVLNEAREYLDSDDSVVWRQMMLNLFPGTSMEKFFFGDAITMKNISLNEFEDFYQIYRNPKNSILFISTNSKKYKGEIVKYLKNFYNDKEKQVLFSNKKIEYREEVKGEIVKFSILDKPDRSQSNLRLGYGIEKFSKRERVIYGVANSVLLGGFSGTIIQRLRDDAGLIYWMHLGRNTFKDNVSYIMFSTGCEKKNRDLVIAKIKEVVQDTIERLVQKDIDRTIPIKVYNHKSPPNAFEDLSELVDSVIYDHDYIQTEEYLKILADIDVNDVKRLMQKIFKEENSSVAVLE